MYACTKILTRVTLSNLDAHIISLRNDQRSACWEFATTLHALSLELHRAHSQVISEAKGLAEILGLATPQIDKAPLRYVTRVMIWDANR